MFRIPSKKRKYREGMCRDCKKIARRAYYDANYQKILAYGREYKRRTYIPGSYTKHRKTKQKYVPRSYKTDADREKNHRKRMRRLEHYREVSRQYYRRNRERILSVAKAYRNTPAEKLKQAARSKTNKAILNGTITRVDICEMCKVRKSENVHHEDYNKPLEVMWLCTICHGLRHRELNRIKREQSSQPLSR